MAGRGLLHRATRSDGGRLTPTRLCSAALHCSLCGVVWLQIQTIMTSAADFYFDPAGPMCATPTAEAGGGDAAAPLLVAYQGEPGAYSEQAVRQLFEQANGSADTAAAAVRPLPCPSFSAVFEAVASGAAPYCLVPIENSLGGSFHDNYDLLLRHRVTCVAELQFKVSHCVVRRQQQDQTRWRRVEFVPRGLVVGSLTRDSICSCCCCLLSSLQLALPGVRLEDIKSCYSHPQALAQCEEYLSKLGIAAVKQYDTAGSAKMIAEQGLRNVAAIASELAAKTYGLEVLARRIEDDEGNYTRFLLLAPATTKNQQALYFQAQQISGSSASESASSSTTTSRSRSGSYSGVLHPNVANLRFSPLLTRTTFKTSLVCTLPDCSGALFKALSVFALRDMQMCKIESRPCKHVNFLQADETQLATRADAAGVQVASAAGAQPAKGGNEGPHGAGAGAGTGAGDAFKYLFFIDTLSSLSQNESLKNGVRHLREYAPFLRVLGSYPVFQRIAATTTTTAAAEAPSSSSSSSSAVAATVAAPAVVAKRAGGLKIGIWGFGSFGQFLAKTFVAQGHSVFVHSRSDYSALSQQLGVHWVASLDALASCGLDALFLSMSILSFEASVRREFPWPKLRNCVVVDVLSVKEHPKAILLDELSKPGVDKSVDILCTHPMFGPESGKFSWNGLAFMYDQVKASNTARTQAVLKIFADEGCRMLQMSCEMHDRLATQPATNN